MARLSEEKIAKIKQLYEELHTYSAVARAVGCSPATVKKYAQEEYTPDPTVRIPFNGIIPAVEDLVWPKEDEISNISRLTESELKEIEELWKEL